MSEQDRSRLYALLCEHTDESLAEYVMSCLAPAPLSDLVTKDHLTAELSRYPTKDDLATALANYPTKDDLATALANYPTKDEMAAGFSRMEAQREEDRQASRHRHYWLAGIGLTAVASIWLEAFGAFGAI